MHLPTTSSAGGNPTTRLPHRVLIIGGAYGGLSAAVYLLNLIQGNANRPSHYPLPDLQKRISRRGVQITVLDSRDGIFHTVGTPLAHVSPASTSSMWRPFTSFPQLSHPNLTFKRGTITRLDPVSKTAFYTDRTGVERTESYHYLIAATGLRRGWPVVPRALTQVEYEKDARAMIDGLVGARGGKVVVVGGGAVGIEFAGEVKHSHPQLDVTLVHSRDELLSAEPLPEEFKSVAKRLLEELGVRVITGARASVEKKQEGEFRIALTNGEVLEAGAVIEATARHVPVTEFLPGSAVDENGFVKVVPTLNFTSDTPNSPFHYAIGDIAAWSGIRRAGGAMAMGSLAATNLYASILTSEDPDFAPKHAELPEYPVVMGLAVGGQAIVYSAATGVEWGKKTMEMMFQEDLGWNYCLKFMGLADEDEAVETKPEKEAVLEELKELSVSNEAVVAVA